jgi:hypothetical protein
VSERKARVRKPKSTEPSLFGPESVSDPNAEPQLILTSSFAIGPLLSRGCLLGLNESPGEPHLFSPMLQSRAPLPASWVDVIVSTARNVIPIAIQLRPNKSVRNIALGDAKIGVDAVCLSDVAALLFRNEKELVRFSSLEFGNYSIDSARIPVRVDARAFSNPNAERPADPDSDAVQESRDQSGGPVEENAQVLSAVRRADSLAGFTTYLLSSSPGRHSWMRGVQAVAHGQPKWSDEASWAERLAAVICGGILAPCDVDSALLAATVDVIFNLPVEDGWPAEKVLSEVRRLALTHIGAENTTATRDIELWTERARDVLNAKTEPSSLSDDAHVTQRSVLLLLLRGDVDAIATDRRSSGGRLRPGPNVVGLASALAAYRSGARALPASCKSGPPGEASGRLIRYVGEIFAGLLAGDSKSLFPSGIPRAKVAYRRIATLQGEWVTTVNERELSRIPASFDTGLERLLTMGRHLGFDFVEHGDTGLETDVTQANGKQRPVYVKVLKAEAASSIVRFSSPTLELKGVNSRSRLPKEFLLNLLVRNADPDMNCRFAVDDEEGLVVVLVDQLLGTLDEAEFRQHVQHVADVASKFEMSRAARHDVS